MDSSTTAKVLAAVESAVANMTNSAIPEAAITNITESVAATLSNQNSGEVKAARSWLGLFARFLVFLIKLVPGILYWLITFTTMTLPTFLFTLFSTSLTFTMNATTLYVVLCLYIAMTNSPL